MFWTWHRFPPGFKTHVGWWCYGVESCSQPSSIEWHRVLNAAKNWRCQPSNIEQKESTRYKQVVYNYIRCINILYTYEPRRMVDEPRIVGYLPVKPGIWMFYEGMWCQTSLWIKRLNHRMLLQPIRSIGCIKPGIQIDPGYDKDSKDNLDVWEFSIMFPSFCWSFPDLSVNWIMLNANFWRNTRFSSILCYNFGWLKGLKPPCPVPPPRSPANVCGRASATSPVASRGFGDFAPQLWPGIRGKWEVPWENGGLMSFFVLNGGLMGFHGK